MGKKVTSATKKSDATPPGGPSEKASPKLKRAKKTPEPTPGPAAALKATEPTVTKPSPSPKPSENRKPAEATKAKAIRAKAKTAVEDIPAVAARPASTLETALPALPVVISHDEIALRAYFIAQSRHQHGIPGDPGQDWVEAERQLREESAQRPAPLS